MTDVQRAIDIHAHILELDTARQLNEVEGVSVSFTPTEEGFATLDVNGEAYSMFPKGGWDVETRLNDMRRYGFDRQLLAITPQTLLYDAAPETALTTSRIQNDAIARLVRDMPDRFGGLATVPMQAPELAAKELRRR